MIEPRERKAPGLSSVALPPSSAETSATTTRLGAHQRLGQLFVFGSLLASGVAFSLVLYVARLFYQEKVVDLIYFQSTSVFGAFIIQSGLRAALRNHYHLGRIRLVKAVENTACIVFLALGAVFSLAFAIQDRWPIYPAFAALHAELTMLLGMRIAEGKKNRAVVYSVLIFVTVVGASWLIAVSEQSLAEMRLTVESLSVLLLIFFVVRLSWFKARVSYRLITALVWNSRGLHASSFLIALSEFLLSQYIVALAAQENAIALAFADVKVFCGVQVLVLSRWLMMVEGRVIREGRVLQLTVGLLAWSAVFSVALYMVIATIQNAWMGFVYLSLGFVFMGKLPLGAIAQYINERFRKDVYWSLVLADLLLFGAMVGELPWLNNFIAILLFSPAIASIYLLTRSFLNRADYFIRARAASEGSA